MMKNCKLLVTGLFIVSGSVSLLSAQPEGLPLSLNLNNVVDLAITQSTSIRFVQNTNVSYYWRYRNYKTRFRPQLTLTGDLPNYRYTTTPVTQEDGSIEFRQIHYANTSAEIALSQPIPLTGTSVYAATSVYRNQDFIKETTGFSGTPFEVGFYQPLFAYNWMKWYRKTESMVYERSQRIFIESIEEISLAATRRFFTYLKVQTNYNLAEQSLSNSQNNLLIAETRKKLGTISENDFARIELSVLNAKKALNSARMALKNADFELKSYVGLDLEQVIRLEIPLDMRLFYVDPQKALEEAKVNRKEPIDFDRRKIVAEGDLVQAKRNAGLSATLRGSYGMSNTATEFPGIYENPEKQRIVRLSVAIPILDWGKSASQIKLAESERELVMFDVEQDQKEFERGIIVQVEQFSLLKDQMETARQADKVAENGYEIALKKFQNGEISITDLNISLSEREKAKRDYIMSIEDYWIAYYNLRILTLYDFEMGEKIWYNNPQLANEKM